MKASPKKRDDISSDGARSSVLRNIGVRVSDKVSKKVFGPSKYFVPGKEKRGRPPDLFLFDSVKSLYKYAIKNSVMKADLDFESDAERAPLSEMSLDVSENITIQSTQLTPPIDPYWRPHELNSASPKLADDLTTEQSVPEITKFHFLSSVICLTEYLPEDSSCKEKDIDSHTLSMT